MSESFGSAGYVTLDVIPTLKGSTANLTRQLTAGMGSQASRAGAVTGEEFGQSFARTAKTTGETATAGIFADAEKGAAVAGLGMGRRFGTALHESLGEYVKTIGATVAGVFAYEKVKEFIGDIVSEGQQAQQTEQLLEAHLESTGNAAHVTAAHIEELAARQSSLVGIDKDTIEQTAAVELTFANIRNEMGRGNNVFDQTLTATENLAAAYKYDLSSAMRLVGRAVNDPVQGLTMLTRVGVSFTQATKDQIAALESEGKGLEAQKIVLEQLEQRFGGSARAADTPLQQLRTNWEDFEQTLGEKAIPYANKAAGALNSLAHLVGEVPAPVRDAALAFTALYAAEQLAIAGAKTSAFTSMSKRMTVFGGGVRAAAKALVGFRGGAAVAGIGLAEFSANTSGTASALAGIGSDVALGAAAFGPWGAAAGGAIGILTHMGHEASFTATDVDTLTKSFNTNTGAITQNTRASVANTLQQQGTLDKAREAGLDLADVTSAALGNKQALQSIRQEWIALNPALATGAQQSRAIQIALSEGSAASGASQSKQAADIKAVLSAIGYEQIAVKNAQGQWENLNDALHGNDQQITHNTSAWTKNVRKIAAATTGLTAYKNALAGIFNPGLNLQAALDALQQGWLDLSADVKQNAKSYHDAGTSLSGFTREGLANREMLRGQVTNIEQVLGAEKAHGASVQKLSLDFATYRQKLIDSAVAAGFNKTQIEHMLATYGFTPKLIATQFKLEGTTLAEQMMEATNRRLSRYQGRHITEYIDIKTRYIGGSGGGGHSILDPGTAGSPLRRAGGGPIIGPGSPRSDNIPVLASPGEYVLNAKAYRENKTLVEGINAGVIRGYANGGPVLPLGPAARSASLTVTESGSGAVVRELRQTNARLDRMQRRLDRLTVMIGNPDDLGAPMHSIAKREIAAQQTVSQLVGG